MYKEPRSTPRMALADAPERDAPRSRSGFKTFIATLLERLWRLYRLVRTSGSMPWSLCCAAVVEKHSSLVSFQLYKWNYL